MTDSDQLLLHNDGIRLTTRNMSPNGEWDVKETTTRTEIWTYAIENNDSTSGDYNVHAVWMTLRMKRKGRYILTNIQFPCIVTSGTKSISEVMYPLVSVCV